MILHYFVLESKNHKSCAKMNNLFVNKDIGRKTCVKTKTSNLACADQNEHRNMNGKGNNRVRFNSYFLFDIIH